MGKDTVLEKTRYLLNSSRERKKHIEDFIASNNQAWDSLRERRNNISRFSKFLTFKGIASWSEVTPSTIQSFIVLNQDINSKDFNLTQWIDSLKGFFDFLIDKNIIQDNPFLREDIFSKDDIEDRLTPVKACLRCGVKLDNRIAKYCKKCAILVKKEAVVRWNKEHKKQLREYRRRWIERNPDKLKQYRLRYTLRNKEKLREQGRLWKERHADKIKEYNKEYRKRKTKQTPAKIISTPMSDWCKELRGDPAHLSWMTCQKKRKERIAEIQNRFSCYWEDKFREIYENYNHEDTAKKLNLNYHTVLVWAKHLKLKRLCTYCGKKLVVGAGNIHPKCKEKLELSQKKQKNLGIRKLLGLIDPTINVEVIDFNENNIIELVETTLERLSDRQAFILKNRYPIGDFEKRKTLAELGSVLGLTRERVRQLESEAIKRLSRPSSLRLIREKLISIIFKEKGLSEIEEKLGIGQRREISDMPLSEIEMSVRASNCLRNTGIKTLGELTNKTESEMLSIRSLGRKTLRGLRRILDSFGLKFENETLSNLQYERVPLQFKKYRSNNKKSKEKCLFPGCEVTPHRGKYCARHKSAWQRRRTLELTKIEK